MADGKVRADHQTDGEQAVAGVLDRVRQPRELARDLIIREDRLIGSRVLGTVHGTAQAPAVVVVERKRDALAQHDALRTRDVGIVARAEVGRVVRPVQVVQMQDRLEEHQDD